jgi:hypothetical protein
VEDIQTFFKGDSIKCRKLGSESIDFNLADFGTFMINNVSSDFQKKVIQQVLGSLRITKNKGVLGTVRMNY